MTMYRQGRYTKRRGPIVATKGFLKRRLKWWKKLPKWKKFLYPSLPVLAFLIITPIATYLYYYNDIGNIDRLLNSNNTGVVLLDVNGKPFFSTGNGHAEHRSLVPLDQISDYTEHALLSAEDKDFYKHGGFSFVSILRAMYTNVVSRGIEGGGSTLTQQLAKNTLLTTNQTIMRKYQELTIAMAIEQRYSKDQILDMYLNSVYYGDNAFGIQEAAKVYFGTTPAQLTLAQSAMLVGLLPAPSAYSPVTGNITYAKERQKYVLNRMAEDKYITQAEADAAYNENLVYASQDTTQDNPAPHFTEMVLNQLYDKYGEEKVERSGYQVTTTLDLTVQTAANKSVADNIANVAKNGGSNASVVAIDPKTGAIRAMVGSADWNNTTFGKVNMATTARQPGSTFKPIYYTAALADGVITPATVLHDVRTDFGGYVPLDYDKRFRGNVTVRQALDWSLNIPSVEVMQTYGISKSITAAQKLGITTLDKNKTYGLPLAIGSAEVPLVEMTNAYAAFANAGTQYDTTSIALVKDKYDTTIFTADKVSRQSVSAQGAYLISNILSDNQTRSYMFGSSLNVKGTDGKTKTVAVKTGTTDDYRDAWTIGYTPDIAIGVWTGNNDNTPMTSSGGEVAGPIWREMMGQVIGSANPSFVQPTGITKATVCTAMGSKTDVFLSNNVPNECSQPDTTKSSDNQDNQASQKCTIAGKTDLSSTDPNCKEDMCTIKGLTQLAANDPKCSATDSDNDGVPDVIDQCPNTPAGTTVDDIGCSTTQSPNTGTGSGSTTNSSGKPKN